MDKRMKIADLLEGKELPIFLLEKITYLYDQEPIGYQREFIAVSHSQIELAEVESLDPEIETVYDEFDYCTSWLVESVDQAINYIKENVLNQEVITGIALCYCVEDYVMTASIYNPNDPDQPFIPITKELEFEVEKFLNSHPRKMDDSEWEEFLTESHK